MVRPYKSLDVSLRSVIDHLKNKTFALISLIPEKIKLHKTITYVPSITEAEVFIIMCIIGSLVKKQEL